jgi:hypothetical protein
MTGAAAVALDEKILALLEVVEKTDLDQLFEEYMQSHGENVLSILRTALTLKEMT